MRSKIIVGLLLLACAMTQTPCNATHPFVLSGTCYMQCPWVPPTQYYSYTPNYDCRATCPPGYYAFNGNLSCQLTCPTTPNVTYYDHINSKCVSSCPVNTYASSNYSCQTSCPSGTWGDPLQWNCVTTCASSTYYANVTVPLCVTKCPSNYYAYPIDRKCYIGGSCPTTPVVYFADDTTSLCTITCPSGYYKDTATGRCLIYCSSGFFAYQGSGECLAACPTGYFRSITTRTCVRNCTLGEFADSITNNCTTYCSTGYFGDSNTAACVLECTFPQFGDPSIRLCLDICTVGLFADNQTMKCLNATNCHSNTVGDPTTNTCINPTNCPTSPYMFADMTNKICTTRCSGTWGQTVTRTCVASCPWNPSTYVTWANSDNRQCVTKCPEYPIQYADNFTKTCTTSCPQAPTVNYSTYADPVSQACVQQCPNGYYVDTVSLTCVTVCDSIPLIQFFNPLNGSCVATCPLGYFAQDSTLTCVLNCSASPRYYAYQPTKKCLAVCPTHYYGDNSTGTCVVECPQTTLQYADPSTNLCVDQCPLIPDYYGLQHSNQTRSCVATCPLGFYADPVTRLCILKCNITLGYYGQKLSPVRKCVLNCNAGWFKNNNTAECLNVCPNYPTKLFGDPVTTMCTNKCSPHLYADAVNNLCVLNMSCPSGKFGDNSTNLCVSRCPAFDNTFGDSYSRTCVQVCAQGHYADPITRICSTSCSSGLYKDISSKSCVTVCPSMPSLYADPNTFLCSSTCTNSYYAYDAMRKCVAMCPSTPPYYANLQTNRCVTACPNDTYMFFSNTFRGCVANCPQKIYSASYVIDTFADNTTWSCVEVCPQTNLFAFSHPDTATIRLCVSTCPMVNGTVYYFAQNITQSCVTACPFATLLTYGDIFNSMCVVNCSRDQYRDNTTARCVYHCSSGYFADNSTWNCVSDCPVGTYAETTNRTCSLHCPTHFYADNTTRYCVALCNQTAYLFSDNTTWQCIPTCTSQPDYFSDNNTRLCSKQCTGGLFTDPPSQMCMPALNCSNNLVGDPVTGRCVDICPIGVPSFLDQAINQCQTACPSGFYADNSTMLCVPECPFDPDYYAYNHSTLGGLCLLYCPVSPTPYYRHNITRQCLTLCPGPTYFRDVINMKCVTQCPPYYYAQTVNQICVLNCSSNIKYGYNGTCYDICPNSLNADPTTYLCVQVCPFGFFAQNGSCVHGCNSTLFADPFLKQCVAICSPDYYAYSPTNQCRQDCQPQYKYYADQTCQISCPITSNLTTNLYRDATTFSCRNKCLPTWYADNMTGNCQTTCSSTLYADNSTGLCVIKCPSTPDYYGYNRICYHPCPLISPMVYAENDTRTCMPICPNGSFADSYNRRCVAICTDLQFGNQGVEPVCVAKCPSPLYGHNVTKTCISVCPNGTFGQNTTRMCLQACPTATYADSHINLCVSQCNASLPQFADDSTQSCVPVCPIIPSLYGQLLVAGPKCVPICQTALYYTLNTTRRCVPNCPSPYFADSVTQDCAQHCQINFNFYADNDTRTCRASCPNITIGGQLTITYADDTTKRCVFQCPFVPSLYGDNSTNRCKSRCPTNSFGDNQTRLCLATCFFGVVFNGIMKYTFAENTTSFCVYKCPSGSWAHNFTYQCVSLCNEGTYADNSTWKCVHMCPSNPVSFAYAPTRVCQHSCPVGYFASEVGRICMNLTCPTSPFFYYRDYQNNHCTRQCVYPYFGEVSSQSCAQICSYGFYQNLGEMTCSSCPTTCLTCVNPSNCSTCQPGLYEYVGQCVTSCPSFPVYYYKYDPSFSCIQFCPSPYFGFLGTGKCELTCPSTFYKNQTTSSCQACPVGCDGCYIDKCTSCITGYVHVIKYFTCSKMCSLALPYYLSGNCVSTCPGGTFLLDDLVTCQKCNVICAECSQVATNCTKCQGRFWYNYNCVQKCPSSYYVDSNNFCQKCSNNPTFCLLPPLSYTFRTQVINYQLFVIVEFNRDTNLNAPKFLLYARFRTSKGVLKSSGYIIRDSTARMFRIQIRDSSSLNQLGLSISFEPGVIFDSSGLGLSTITVTNNVPLTSSITPAIQQEGETAHSKVNVVSWLLIAVLLIMMVKANYPLIILLDLLQYIHLHVYVVLAPLPYLYMQALSALKNVNFVFLPTLWTHPSPDSNATYYNFQTDTTFLGNCHPLVFFLIIFGSTYLVFFLLSRHCCTVKSLRNKAKSIFKNRMRYSFLHEIFYYPAFYVIFFALYQFTGANSSIEASGTNIAAAVIVLLGYTVWLIAITYIGSKYRNRLDKIPQKYKFLVYEDSKFPMEIPLRALFKFMVGFVLIAGEISVQLVLLMVFNLIYLIYTLCFRPSKKPITNYLNIFIMAGFIVCEIVLFIYSISDMNSDYQQLISIVLLALMGIMILTVLVWIIYRLGLWIRHDLMGVPLEVQPEKVKGSIAKHSKTDYQKIKYSTKQNLFDKSHVKEKQDKEMMISELNFNDDDQRASDAPSITAEEAIKMFTYHHVPKKTEGLLKQQRQLMGIKEDVKERKQIVIELDEDQLINNDSEIRESGRLRSSNKRVKSKGSSRPRAHLRIDAQESLQELQDIRLKQKTEKESQSQESNYWTRRQRRQKPRQLQPITKAEPQNKIVWDEQENPQE